MCACNTISLFIILLFPVQRSLVGVLICSFECSFTSLSLVDLVIVLRSLLLLFLLLDFKPNQLDRFCMNVEASSGVVVAFSLLAAQPKVNNVLELTEKKLNLYIVLYLSIYLSSYLWLCVWVYIISRAQGIILLIVTFKIYTRQCLMQHPHNFAHHHHAMHLVGWFRFLCAVHKLIRNKALIHLVARSFAYSFQFTIIPRAVVVSLCTVQKQGTARNCSNKIKYHIF